MTRHSDKALTTLSQMGVASDAAWTVPEIVWTKERRTVRAKVPCPVCLGLGQVVAGEPVPEEANARAAYRCRATTRCPRCFSPGTRAARFGQGTGEVFALVEKEVMVGRPQWHPATKFDSRFHAACRCGLCGKKVLFRVPLETAGHGMWAGEDCARLFLRMAAQSLKTAQNGEHSELEDVSWDW